MLCIKEVEVAKSVDDLMTSQSIGGQVFPNFELLHAKSASKLKGIISNQDFRRRINVKQQHAQKQDRSRRRRQTAHMMYKHFRGTGAHEAALDLSDLFTFSLQGNDVQEFDTRWDQTLLSATEIPKETVLESSYKMKIRESVQLQTVLAMYDQEIDRDRAMPNFQRWKIMVRRYIDQTIRTRNFRARNESIETGVLVKSQHGSALKGEWEKCYQWKAHGHSSREDSCSFSHGNNRGQPAQSSSLAPRAQRQIDGRRPSQGGSPRGSSPSGKRGQKPCKNDLKGNCTNPSYGCWYLPENQNYNSESGCNLGDICLLRHT